MEPGRAGYLDEPGTRCPHPRAGRLVAPASCGSSPITAAFAACIRSSRAARPLKKAGGRGRGPAGRTPRPGAAAPTRPVGPVEVHVRARFHDSVWRGSTPADRGALGTTTIQTAQLTDRPRRRPRRRQSVPVRREYDGGGGRYLRQRTDPVLVDVRSLSFDAGSVHNGRRAVAKPTPPAAPISARARSPDVRGVHR
ncbi:hypothetical protein HBB16_16360 [Pseudonocardia sp. MCCB 268]|nr:hypothetical protein [Pseudonocardia cytotoxica]